MKDEYDFSKAQRGRFYNSEAQFMSNSTIREQLHQQIDSLPDEIVEQIVDFTLFVMARRKIKPIYDEWSKGQWQDFALGQFFREEDEVEYTLNEAKEVYKS